MATSASGIRAGAAFVELFLKDNLGNPLKKAANRLRAFGATVTGMGLKLTGLGAAITSPLLAAAKVFAVMGDTLAKSSQRTGIAVEALSALKYAAEQSGVGLESLETGLRGMSRMILSAINGSQEATGALEMLGLTLEDLSGKSPDEQFKLIADQLSKETDATIKAALAMKVFGKSGVALIPLLKDGAAGIEKLEARARELGLTMSGSDATAAEKFGDIMEDLWKQAKMVTFHVGAAVAQALQPWLEKATTVGASVIAWVKANRGLVITIGAVAVGIMAAGAALVTFGVAMQAAAIALKAAGTAAMFVLSPLGLVSAALVGGVTAWVLYSDSGRKAMNDVKETAQTTFAGISDAMAAGDIALAAQILWAGLKLAWLQGTTALQQTWAKFKALFVQTAVAAFYGVQEIWANVSAGLQTAWAHAASAFTSIWRAAVNEVSGLFDKLAKDRAKGDLEAAQNRVKRFETNDPSIADFPPEFKKKALAEARADVVKFGGEVKDRDKQTEVNAEKDAADEVQRQLDLKSRLAEINTEQKKTLDDIAKAELAISAAASQNATDDIAKLEAEKKELQARLAALRGEAGRAAGDGAGQHTQFPLEEAAKVAREGVELAQGQMSARSGFNANALLSLQGGRVQERTAKATEQTAKNTQKLLNNSEDDDGGVFV